MAITRKARSAMPKSPKSPKSPVSTAKPTKKTLKTKEVAANKKTPVKSDKIDKVEKIEKIEKIEKAPKNSKVDQQTNEATNDGLQEKPASGYLDEVAIKRAVLALRKYTKVKEARDAKSDKKKDLLEAGNENKGKGMKVMAEVVFKNIPANSKTYIHNVVLPHHWRLQSAADADYEIAVFVPHKKPENEAQKIQFQRDRDLDIENTHSHYQSLFEEKLDERTKAMISRLITSKELATQFNTFQKIDRLAKTYDLFLGDKKLMCNKMNALPRRLGRRFWVREKKVPIIVKLDAPDLGAQFTKALNTEPFYVVGNSSTERIQLGNFGQKTGEIVANIKTFLDKLHALYCDQVRFIRLRSNSGLALPVYADLSRECPKEVKMLKKRTKPKPVVGDFDLVPGDAQIKVHASGEVKVVRPEAKLKRKVQESPVERPSKKRARK